MRFGGRGSAFFILDLRVFYSSKYRNFSLPQPPIQNYLAFLDQAWQRGAFINRRDKTENAERNFTLRHFIRRTEELHALHRNTALVCSRTEHSG